MIIYEDVTNVPDFLLLFFVIFLSFLEICGKWVENISAISSGIIGAIILQIAFSQIPVMNTLFQTAPLTVNQWLICLIPIIPMIPLAVIVNKFFPANSD